MQDPNKQDNHENQTPNQEHQQAPQQGDGEHQAEGTAGQGVPGEDVGATFQHLLGELGDHREFGYALFHVDLPVILIDDGLHVYGSLESMEEAGLYEYTHHHIYRTGTEQPPALDLSPTSLVAYQWIAMALLMLMFIPMARKYRKKGPRALKGFHNAMEAVVTYVRDDMVLSNTGKEGAALVPIFLTFFFFILVMNLVGLVPGAHTSTSSINTTAGLAIIAFFVIQLASIFKNGLGSWLKHLTGGVHWLLWPIMVPVEILGLFTKPFALAIRLFANMTAGHVILLSLIGLIFVTTAFIPVTVGFSIFILLLELLVAFIQAYIFTMLAAVFTGMGMASHDHDHGDAEHAAAH